jgi:pentalenene oxygenase
LCRYSGSAVRFSAYALHRNPGLYPHPDQFTPDRWSPGHSDDLPRGAYLPFGTGNRGCIGEPVAWAQATTILAAIAQRWTLAAAPQADIRPEARMLLMPGRLPLIPQARRPAPPPPFAGGLG